MTTATSITVRVSLTIRRRPGRKTVVRPVRRSGEAALSKRADPALVKALARAFRYQRLLDEGRYASISEIAAAERIERGYLGSLLRLTLLSPDIVDPILDGSQPERMTLHALMDRSTMAWERQQLLQGEFSAGSEQEPSAQIVSPVSEAARTNARAARGTQPNTRLTPAGSSRSGGGRYCVRHRPR